jgi:monoamine oxidase
MHSETKNRVEVIIIGAGFAGLAAASELLRAGLEFVIIEARDRLGGRAFTVKPDDKLVVELGAEFIHGRSSAIWEIITTKNLPTYDTSSELTTGVRTPSRKGHIVMSA